jgi:predicted ATPase
MQMESKPTLRPTAIHISNFKSLEKVSLSLSRRMAVLVGRNNSGKSSVLDAFAFVREAIPDPNGAVKRRGKDATALIFARDAARQCTLSFEFEVPDVLRAEALRWLASKRPQNEVTRLTVEDITKSSFLRSIRYSLSFGRSSCSEEIWTNSPSQPPYPYLLGQRSGETQLNDEVWQAQQIWNHNSATQRSQATISRVAAISRPIDTVPALLSPNVQTDSQFAVNWIRAFFVGIYHVPPLRKPDPRRDITSAEVIDPEGSTLADVLHTLKNNQPEVFQAIEADLKRLVDSIEAISTPTEQARTTVQISENFGPLGRRDFDLGQTSSGTAQLLIILTQLHTQPANALLMLEELESMLHPRAQAELSRILRAASVEHTILIATHSAVIASETMQEALFIVSRSSGVTTIRPFEQPMANDLIEEMGIRPSYHFQANAVLFVEGIFDESVLPVWFKREGTCKRVLVIESGGYSNIQFFANAEIMQKQAAKPEIFALVDGDTRQKGDYKKIKNALNIPDDHIFELPCLSLESYLADVEAIRKTFPAITMTNAEISSQFQGKTGDDLKRALQRVLREVGGYTPRTAALIAEHVAPPEELKVFFEKIEASDAKLSG